MYNKSNYIRELETKYAIFSHTCFEIAPVTFLLELFIEQIDIKINQRNNQGGLYYRIMILY